MKLTFSRKRRRHSLAVLAGALWLLCVAGSAAAQETREALIRKQRQEKAGHLTKPKRAGLEKMLRKVEDDLLVERLFNPTHGLFMRFGGLAEGSGFGGGPAYRIGNPDINFTVTTAASIKRYWVADARLSMPRLAGGHMFADLYARKRDFPQEDFFGIGADSREDDRSNYALRDTSVQGTVGVRPVSWVTAGTRVEYLDPRIGEGKDDLFPSVEDLFSDAQAPGLAAQPDFLRYEGFVDLDYRDSPFNARKGARLLLTFNRYQDRDLDRFSFDRVELDAQQYIPFLHRHRVLVLRALVSRSDPDSGSEIPFYLHRTLGGAYTLRGYRAFRFRDNNALLLQGEYRVIVNNFVTGAIFYDAGKVTRDWDDLDFDNLRTNYGFGVRLGTTNGVALRADVAFGGEGTKLLLRFNNVF